MQQPPSGQNWPQQNQTPYGQPSQQIPPNTQYPPQQQWQQPPSQPYPFQQGQWQQPYGQPPPGPGWQPQQPPKKSRKGLWIALAIVAAVIVFGCIGISAVISQSAKSANTTINNAQSTVNTSLTQIATSQPTSAPTQATQTTQNTSGGTWTTTHTFTGNGIQKTAIFTAPDDWKILWKCDPSSFTGGEYNVIVTVYGSDGSIQDIAINATCKAGSTSGETEEHQGGQVYLDINSEADWTIQVQELK